MILVMMDPYAEVWFGDMVECEYEEDEEYDDRTTKQQSYRFPGRKSRRVQFRSRT